MGLKAQGEMMYLGAENKVSGKGAEYQLASFMYRTKEGVPCIYKMYVKGDRLKMITQIAQLKLDQKVLVTFDIISFNGKPEVELLALEV